MDTVQTFSDLIDKLGGVRGLSAQLGKTENTVAGMKRRNSISPEYWPDLLRLAGEHGLSLSADTLVAMRAKRARTQ